MKRHVFALVLLTAIVIAGAPVPTSAQSTIETRICDDIQGAMITIASPVSDSLVDDSSVVVSGEVLQSNQLEILVNDALNSVVPLDSSASMYNALIHLPVGTHKITVTAIDACQVKNASQSIVLTYQPAQTPSTGSEIPTGVSEEGSTIGAPQAIGDSAESRAPSVVERFIAPVLNTIVDSLDLQISHPKGVGSHQLTNMSRFAMTIGGLALVFMASPISIAASNWFMAGLKDATRWQMVARRGVRGIGALLLLFVFIL